MTTMRTLLRLLSVALLLAAVALSVPTGAVHAAKRCQDANKRDCCELNGVWYGLDETFYVDSGHHKQYGCGEDGDWVVITDDEYYDAHKTAPPLRYPVGRLALTPWSGGGVLTPR